MADFTRKQGQYLALIDAWARLRRRPPAEADMQRFFRLPHRVHESPEEFGNCRRSGLRRTRRMASKSALSERREE